jgi:hypothetical protein
MQQLGVHSYDFSFSTVWLLTLLILTLAYVSLDIRSKHLFVPCNLTTPTPKLCKESSKTSCMFY